MFSAWPVLCSIPRRIMLPKLVLVRTARLLRKAWLHAAAQQGKQLDNALDHVEVRFLAFQHARRRLDKLRLASLLPSLMGDLLLRLRQLREASDAAQSQVEQRAGTVPTVRVLVEELQQIDADIGALAIDPNVKSITSVTEPITLQDIHLGPFAIRFYWNRLERAMDYTCFDIVALESNPAATDENVTHPHVKDEKLCAGDACAPIKSALENGRLADAFNLIRSVLLTYNPSSPHVALEDWDGTSCYECGYSTSSDDLSYCESCGHDHCSECLSSCACCYDSRCTGCLEKCAVCQEYCCRGCLEDICEPGRSCCSQCRRNCPRCLKPFAVDEKAVD